MERYVWEKLAEVEAVAGKVDTWLEEDDFWKDMD